MTTKPETRDEESSHDDSGLGLSLMDDSSMDMHKFDTAMTQIPGVDFGTGHGPTPTMHADVAVS